MASMTVLALEMCHLRPLTPFKGLCPLDPQGHFANLTIYSCASPGISCWQLCQFDLPVLCAHILKEIYMQVWIRPKKRCLFALFLTDLKFWKTRVGCFFVFVFCFFWYSSFVFLNKYVQNKMSEYILTVPKGILTRYNGIQPLPTPGSYQFWGSACPRIHTHE